MIYEKEKSTNISFPLGGIGTGCIGLTGNGELIDWEIFNRPNKNTRNGYSHFAIRATVADKTIAKVLQGDASENLCGSYDGSKKHIGFGFGVHSESMAGFPHFRNHYFEGNFPIAHLTLEDDDFPGNVRLTAFNPMIPNNSFDSSLPAALFEWEIENTADKTIEYAIAFSVRNPALVSENCTVKGKHETCGIVFSSADKEKDEIGYSDLCVLTDHEDSAVQEYWYRGKWQDTSTMFWNNFSSNMRIPERHFDVPGEYDHGSIIAYLSIAPQEKKTVRFVLSWNVPNQYNYWNPCTDQNGNDVTWKNYYATQFKNSFHTAEYIFQHFDRLRNETLRFANGMKLSSLPEVIYDAISSNLSVLKTPTVLRLEDGSLWGWEGCNERIGCCEGSCQHVWNYAYALPYLFPDLERSLRENTIKYALTETGATKFRVPLPVGRELGFFRSCVDGHMGEIIKCYREWKLSGDTKWLLEIAPDIFKMLDYATSPDNPDCWDIDRDGILEGRQHHTLDMELFGPSSWLQGFYLLALDCGARIANIAGDVQRASEYRARYDHGKKWTNENLFNGSYFCQKIDLSRREIVARFNAEADYWNEEAGEIKYQVAEGCIIDQMLADWHASLIGLPSIFEQDKKNIALKNLYANNYKDSMRNVANMWRNFAINDEGGTIICAYPVECKKPAIPIPYCEEVMTGFEYAAAGLMLQNGFVSEGEEIIYAIRNRYDGQKRNPWNEIECGSNYARSMASFALLPIYSGLSFDSVEQYIGFAPLSGEGVFLWSVAGSWGMINIDKSECILSVFGEPLSIASFGLRDYNRVHQVLVDEKEQTFTVQGNRICITPKLVSNSFVLKMN